MRHLNIDIETFSSNDIGAGVYKYVEAEDFEILLFAYAYDFGQVEVVDLARGETIPDAVIQDLQNPDVLEQSRIYDSITSMALHDDSRCVFRVSYGSC